MIDADERALFYQAQAGDYEAFEELHRRLELPLMRFVRRLIGDSFEVEDIVQDTLIALYTHLPTLDPPEKLRPFLFRVARNRCYDSLRQQGRYESVSVDTDEDDPVGVRIAFDIANAVGETSPEDATAWLLMLMEVKAAMDRLPELQRQALILYCEEGLSYLEIAEVMDVSIGTIKSRLFHAKKSLRGLIPPRSLTAIEEALGLYADEPAQDVTREDVEEDEQRNNRQTEGIRQRAAGARSIS